MTLEKLRTRLNDLTARASAKVAELKDGITAADVTRINAEHTEICAEIEQVRRQLAPADAAAQATVTTMAERSRISAITELAERNNVEQVFVRKHVDAGTTVEAFRAALQDHLAERDLRSHPLPTGHLMVTDSQERGRAEAAVGALLHRFDANAFKLSDDARNYRGMSLLEIGRDVLEQSGIRTRGMGRMEVAGAMLTQRGGGMMATGDFPSILSNVAGKSLRQAYEAAPQTFKPLVRVVTVPDFKPVNRVQLGEAPALERVNEHGEFKRGKMGESAESYSVVTYGKIVAITRQVIVNDDLGAFTRIPRAFGIAAANNESDLVWAIFTGNPTMADGTALFHANHKNIGTGAAIAVASVGAGRTAMATQTGIDGKTLLNLDPQYLIVPKALQTTAEQFVGQIYPAKSVDQVPDSLRRLSVIAEPRLDAASASNWFLAASPSQIDTIELAYLEGHEGVYTETRQGFDTDGLEIKVRQDVAAKAIDWRGLWKNPV